MQSAASPSIPHSPTSTNHTESSRGWMQTVDHCGHPRAVLPQNWSPPSDPGADSLQRRTRLAGAVQLQRPQTADAGSGCTTSSSLAKRVGGCRSRQLERRGSETKRGRSRRFVDPRARRATHHRLQAWLHWLGKTRSADWAGFELARGAVTAAAVLLSSGRMRAGWRLVGHSFNALLQRMCVLQCMQSPS